MTDRRPGARDRDRTAEELYRVSRGADKVSGYAGNFEDATATVRSLHPSRSAQQAAEFGRRFIGPVAKAADATSMQAGFMSDRRRMPWDEALLKNYGGGALRYAGRTMGAGVGAVLGAGGAGAVWAGTGSPVGFAVGGMAGDKIGENATGGVLSGFRAGKHHAQMTIEDLRRVADELIRYNSPKYLLDRYHRPRGRRSI